MITSATRVKWGSHINFIVKRINKYTVAFWHILCLEFSMKTKWSFLILLMFNHCFVLKIIDWDSSYKTVLQPLFISQKCLWISQRTTTEQYVLAIWYPFCEGTVRKRKTLNIKFVWNVIAHNFFCQNQNLTLEPKI